MTYELRLFSTNLGMFTDTFRHSGYTLIEKDNNGNIINIKTVEISPREYNLGERDDVYWFYIGDRPLSHLEENDYQDTTLNIPSDEALKIFNKMVLEASVINQFHNDLNYWILTQNCNSATVYFANKYLPSPYSLLGHKIFLLLDIESVENIFDTFVGSNHKLDLNPTISKISDLIDRFYENVDDHFDLKNAVPNIFIKKEGIITDEWTLSISDGNTKYIIDDNYNSTITSSDNGSTTIIAGGGDDEIIIGKGNAVALGGEGNDSYFYNNQSGHLVIDDKSDITGEKDRIVFDASIRPDMLRFNQNGNDLEVSIRKTSSLYGYIIIKDFFLKENGYNTNLIEKFEFLYNNSSIDFENGRIKYNYLDETFSHGTDFSEDIEVYGENRIIHTGKGNDFIKFYAQSGEIHLGSTQNIINIDRAQSHKGNIDIYAQEDNRDNITIDNDRKGIITIHNFSNETVINTYNIMIYRKIGDDVHFERTINGTEISSVIILKGAAKYYDFGGNDSLYMPISHNTGNWITVDGVTSFVPDCNHGMEHGIPERIYFSEMNNINQTWEYSMNNDESNIDLYINQKELFSANLLTHAMASFDVSHGTISNDINQIDNFDDIFPKIYANNQ